MSRSKMRFCVTIGFAFVLLAGLMCSGATPALAANGTYLRQWAVTGPWGVALNTAGNVYVADVYDAKVYEFSPTGAPITNWKVSNAYSGVSSLDAMDVAVDHAGNVWVTTNSSNHVDEYNGSGTLLNSWNGMGNPSAMAFDSSNNPWVINNGTVYELSGGNWLPFTLNGVDVSGSAWGICIDGANNVYVAAMGPPDLVVKYSKTGAQALTSQTSWSISGVQGDPCEVAVDPDGYVYFSDTDNGRILKFNSTGLIVAKWGSLGTGNGQFAKDVNGFSCGGIGIDSSGNAYVADMGNGRIEEFGTTLNTPASSDWSLGLLAIIGLGIAAVAAQKTHAKKPPV